MPDASTPPFAVGLVLAGRYRLTRLIGDGGMAYVYEGEHVRLEQQVAIKVLRSELWKDAEVIARFEREGRAIGRLRARHVVRVFDVDTSPEGAPFLVMELLRGKGVDAEIVERGALPVGEAVRWLMQACLGVTAAHDAGLIHRDLKPSNLFLSEEDGERIVKVVDFGISRDLLDENAHLTKTAGIVGTPLYMAPEQLEGSKNVDERADVWALGATLYEMLVGRRPFEGTITQVVLAIAHRAVVPVHVHRPDVPVELAMVIDRALAKDPEARWQSPRALADALRPFESYADVAGTPRVLHTTSSVQPQAKTELAVASTPDAGKKPGDEASGAHARVRAWTLGASLVVAAAALVLLARRAPATPVASGGGGVTSEPPRPSPSFVAITTPLEPPSAIAPASASSKAAALPLASAAGSLGGVGAVKVRPASASSSPRKNPPPTASAAATSPPLFFPNP